jgi:HEAT repeat protein
MGLLVHDYAHDQPNVRSAALREELSAVTRPHLRARKGDQIALGALAVALGMMKDRQSVPILVACVKDRGLEKKLRASAAIALGLIGDGSALDPILAALREREDRDLRIDTAAAASLLGSSNAALTLVDILKDPKASQFVIGSVALGLGQVGDHESIPALIEILEPDAVNGVYPDLTRALVAVALGQISDRREIRVLARISKDINYRASVPALDEILTVL